MVTMGGGGIGDPQERWKRAYHGVGTLAAREMLFNISFFPLFYRLKRCLDESTDSTDSTIEKDRFNLVPKWEDDQSQECANYVISGVLSGLVCSLVITPMDVFKTYMFHSREQWSLWSGKQIVAPPLNLLFRGLTTQAFVLGPTFGVVAAVYELA